MKKEMQRGALQTLHDATWKTFSPCCMGIIIVLCHVGGNFYGTVFVFSYIVLKVSLWKGLYQQCPLKPVFRRVCADLVFPGGTKGAVGISAFSLHCLWAHGDSCECEKLWGDGGGSGDAAGMGRGKSRAALHVIETFVSRIGNAGWQGKKEVSEMRLLFLWAFFIKAAAVFWRKWRK